MISADTKDALARDVPAALHCREALLAGLAFYGTGERRAEFVTHRNAVARLFWSLLEDDRKAHPIEMRSATRLQRLPTFAIAVPQRLRGVPAKPLHKCDRLMEVRAAFLACGSLAAGAHGYHLEFVTADEPKALRLQWMLRSAGVAAKTMRRKGRCVIYYKDFEAIAEVLTLIGAYGAVLHLEDVRALRETKNRIHRLVNTEAANLERTAAAAAAQRRVIDYLANAYGLHRLSAPLREIAELRLAHPDESLSELARRCNPPIAKPTASSRLGALTRLAEQLRRGKGVAKQTR
ncbi:MAG TPA: DNA-binding protein WhiA [Candidatus Baltobacteraceae bacterium]|nr:DNA-binding protein WhiA [Candidatus Baltobacteraceae bacterium]